VRQKWFDWESAHETGGAARIWVLGLLPEAEVDAISDRVMNEGDAAVLDLTARFDAIDAPRKSLRVDRSLATKALSEIDPQLRESLEVAAGNIRAVAKAQLESEPNETKLPQGHVVKMREVPVHSVGVYAPGGRAAYPSSVLMCAIPARVAGVHRIALASPPGRDGNINPLVLAAAAMCEIDEIYAMGGAQAIFALAYGTQTIYSVNVIVGPGNAWVRNAKLEVAGAVGIDSLAGPSELMLIAGPETNPEWAALDLCAQAEHGADSPLMVVATDDGVLKSILAATERAASERPGVADAPIGLIKVPSLDDAVDVANRFAPEHLEILVDDAQHLAERIRTAGCIFAGPCSATAFGDYAAGSNHVLPTAAAGRFSGPLGVHTFRRKIATVEVPVEAAAKLGPHVKAIADAEGFPVHGESAMIRTKDT
jgi:histidinol dehydrogenase